MTGEAELATPTGTPEFFDALLEDDPNELYENAPCGYLSTRPDGTIVKVNQTFLTWTGFRRDELVGRRRLQDLLAVGDRIFYETHYAPLLRMQGMVREIAVDVVLSSGERLPVLANSVLKRDAGGEPMVVRTVLFDARERRSYERELVAARQRAEAAEARARELAQTLQSTFMPPVALDIPGLDVAGAYHPAGDGSEVGGDFYDVFPTGRGTHAVVLGDVSGKGADAAVVTALARHVVRAEVFHRPSPAGVLGVLHEAVRRAYPERFCTAVLVEVAAGDDVVLTVCAAGHHLPVKTDGTRVDRLGAAGTILGMLDETHLQDRRYSLEAGETVVLYTDGVAEARRGREFFGDRRIETLVAGGAGRPAAEVAEGLAAAAIDFQDGRPRDDIAVVALRRPS
ncbi:MAG TPA: SpoIIE family protein phosphatase [Acidimicrobiales bacterium]|nr:SpoIIE family protein phosphatase [Acidimicrobiales bacterium]